MRRAPHEFEVFAENEPVPGKAANEPGAKWALVGRVGSDREQPDAIDLRRRLRACLSRAENDGEGERGKQREQLHQETSTRRIARNHTTERRPQPSQASPNMP